MGRKSSAKSSSRPPSSSEPPTEPTRSSKRSSTPLLAAVSVVIVAIVGAFAYTRSGRDAAAIAPDGQAAHAADPAQAAPAQPLKPHTQANLPPLPFQAYAPPRPPDVVRAAYIFAAEHPEILTYVPCFCGCERAGHKGNEDCFVARRNDAGDVVEWDPHGLDCAVCLDVARDAQQMYSSGASVRDIRGAIEKKWASATAHGTHTPTPMPPQKP